MKEAVLHPEARTEVEQSVEFYETRLDGLGLRFLSAVEQRGGLNASISRDHWISRATPSSNRLAYVSARHTSSHEIDTGTRNENSQRE